jgi:hypothetical protein
VSAPDLAEVLLNEGWLYYAPTTFGANPTAPFGGTLLGYVRDVQVRHGIKTRRRRAPDMQRVYEVALTGQECDLAFTLEQWDRDLVPVVFPRVVTTGSPSNLPGMMRVGHSGQPRVLPAVEPVLFAPKDPRHLAALFLRPIPDPAAMGALDLARNDPAVTSIVFTASLNSSFNGFYVDRLEHLTLT